VCTGSASCHNAAAGRESPCRTGHHTDERQQRSPPRHNTTQACLSTQCMDMCTLQRMLTYALCWGRQRRSRGAQRALRVGVRTVLEQRLCVEAPLAAAPGAPRVSISTKLLCASHRRRRFAVQVTIELLRRDTTQRREGPHVLIVEACEHQPTPLTPTHAHTHAHTNTHTHTPTHTHTHTHMHMHMHMHMHTPFW